MSGHGDDFEVAEAIAETDEDRRVEDGIRALAAFRRISDPKKRRTVIELIERALRGEPLAPTGIW